MCASRKDRIDWLYAQQPTPTIDVYLDMIGRELFELCREFPPSSDDVEFLTEAMRQRFAGRLDELPTPSAKGMLMLADLLDWEIDREFERVDFFMRNERYRSAFGSAPEVESMHLLRHLLIECLLMRQETSQRPIKRLDLHRPVAELRRLARALV